MARAETIARLFAPEALEGHKKNLPTNSSEGLPEPVVVAPPVAPGPSRFRIAREDVEPYQLDAATIMASMSAAGPLDRSADLQAIAAREQILRLAQARLRGGLRSRRGAAGPLQYQT